MEDSNTTRIYQKAKIDARIPLSTSTGLRARHAFVDLACVRNESFRQKTSKKLRKTKFFLVYQDRFSGYSERLYTARPSSGSPEPEQLPLHALLHDTSLTLSRPLHAKLKHKQQDNTPHHPRVQVLDLLPLYTSPNKSPNPQSHVVPSPYPASPTASSRGPPSPQPHTSPARQHQTAVSAPRPQNPNLPPLPPAPNGPHPPTPIIHNRQQCRQSHVHATHLQNLTVS